MSDEQEPELDRQESGPQKVVIRDKRRIDPESGEVREPSPVAETAEPVLAVESDVERELRERTDDLLRVKAEFDNYRKRVDRDRLAVVEQAAARVVAELLPVLDDIDRARSHGEVEGGFKSVADSLETALERLGLKRFGNPGEPFDPTLHEAVMHTTSPDVEVPTCTEVMRSGYLFGERLLRPAMVAVADAEPDAAQETG
jgi:molecular chaperone GrpE